jgi:two-component system, OmpR family, alkaline phosphatase synthesis response regulator PhoP
MATQSPSADGSRRDTAIGTTATPQELAISADGREVLVAGRAIRLTATESLILKFLMQSPGTAFRREQILEGVHGTRFAASDRAIDVQINALRKKLGAARHHIETIRGAGYRFRP